MNDTLRHTIDAELGVTQRNADELVMHRTSCKLKSPRTPLAMIAAQQLEASYLVACSTCQPSQRQMTELQSYVADRVELEVDRLVARIEGCADDAEIIGRPLSEQQLKLVELREQSAIDAFLSSAAPKRVREIAQGADVVPLVRKGKHNVRRNARHDQRTPLAAAVADELAKPSVVTQLEAASTKTCVDCQKDVKLTSFPTSTKGGQIVRLDYCRPCRSLRAAAKVAK